MSHNGLMQNTDTQMRLAPSSTTQRKSEKERFNQAVIWAAQMAFQYAGTIRDYVGEAWIIADYDHRWPLAHHMIRNEMEDSGLQHYENDDRVHPDQISGEYEAGKDVMDHVLHTQLKQSLQLTMSKIMPREQYVLSLYFGINVDEHSMQEIAKLMNITTGRVSAIINRALRMLKHPCRSQHISGFRDKFNLHDEHPQLMGAALDRKEEIEAEKIRTAIAERERRDRLDYPWQYPPYR